MARLRFFLDLYFPTMPDLQVDYFSGKTVSFLKYPARPAASAVEPLISMADGSTAVKVSTSPQNTVAPLPASVAAVMVELGLFIDHLTRLPTSLAETQAHLDRAMAAHQYGVAL